MMNPSQVFAYAMVTGLRQVNLPTTCQSAEKIVETIPKLCAQLNMYYECACDVTKAADELIVAGGDLVAQRVLHEEHLEMFLLNFDKLNQAIDKLISQMSNVREVMGVWWLIQEEITDTWFFFNALNKTIVERRNWHLESLSIIIEGLTRSRDGLVEIRARFAYDPAYMVDNALRGQHYFSDIRNELTSNEAMALGWWKSFDEERQLITGKI